MTCASASYQDAKAAGDNVDDPKVFYKPEKAAQVRLTRKSRTNSISCSGGYVRIDWVRGLCTAQAVISPPMALHLLGWHLI